MTRSFGMKRFLATLVVLALSNIAYADDWDIAKLDTARNVSYLDDIEKDVILETNKVRTNPKKYVNAYKCQAPDENRPSPGRFFTAESMKAFRNY